MSDLADRMDQHGVNFHAYADDSPLYVNCNRCDTTSATARLEHCITDIGHWISANCLKLNTDKTAAVGRHKTQLVTFGWIGFAPHPKLQSLLSQERVKRRTSNLARAITGSIQIKAHEKFWRKGRVGVFRDYPFWGTPYYPVSYTHLTLPTKRIV